MWIWRTDFCIIIFQVGKRNFQRSHHRQYAGNVSGASGAGKAGCIRKLPLDAALDAAYINFMTVIDEHLEFIHMMVRENGVREFLSEEEVRSIWKNRIPWLPTLLKRKMEAGEVKEMDFEMAALSVNSILMHYVMKRVTDTGHSTLDDKAWRKRLVDYQVSVWSVEKQPENEKEQE